MSADLFDCHAEEGKPAYGRVVPSRIGTRRLTVLHQPIGVVGIITAWNCPAYNVARAASAALAAGCTVVIRPSEFTPMTAIDMARILLDAGTSAGIVNVVNGDPEAMGQEMLRHPACRKVHLTVGWKESGMGGECGSEGLEEYLETKLVAVGGV